MMMLFLNSPIEFDLIHLLTLHLDEIASGEQIAKLLEFWIHKICNLQEINISAEMKKCSAISGQILQQLELKESFPISRDDQLKNTTICLL